MSEMTGKEENMKKYVHEMFLEVIDYAFRCSKFVKIEFIYFFQHSFLKFCRLLKNFLVYKCT